ncbi:MAG TPA: hypothetical protein ENK57_14745 [Polyangiaceae bacterium]|nr:hypothetical protein [Polyangiaceae bacterium]
MRRISPAVIAAKKRREREDAAKRLNEVVPELESLKMWINDTADVEGALPVSYVRHVVVTTAPALFDLPCGDKKCEEGGHDVTKKVIRRLRRGDTRWTGKSRCRGSKKGEPCARELEVEVEAEYGEGAQAS